MTVPAPDIDPEPEPEELLPDDEEDELLPDDEELPPEALPEFWLFWRWQLPFRRT